MGEVSHDQAGASHDAATAHDDQAHQSPTTAARTLIGRGRRSPDEVATLLRRFPFAQQEILAFLHAALGNSFVQAVVAVLQMGASSASTSGAGTAVAPPAVDEVVPVRKTASQGAKIPLGPVRVTAHGLRVRRTPDTGTQDNIVGGLHHHAQVTALAHEGEWLRIEYHGEVAFIHGDYVEPVVKRQGETTAESTETSPAKPEAKNDAKHDAAKDAKHDASTHHTAPADPTPVANVDPVAVPEPAKVTPPKPEPVTAKPTPEVAHVTPKPEPVAVAKPTPVDDKHVAPLKPDAQVKQPTTPDVVVTAPSSAEMFSRVYTTSVKGKPHHTQVFVSPGTITATPNVAVYFHGYDAQYNIGDKGKGVASGIDVAAEAVAKARNKNTIAILPQGNIGRNDEHGGHMAVLDAGLPGFLASILGPLAADLHLDSLSAGHISLSGHSAGGYEGMASALHGAGTALDSITDVTLMDSDYAESHYREAAKWMFTGGKDGKAATPARNLRIIEQASQLKATGPKPKPGEKWKQHINYHDQFFQPAALTKLAKAHGCTVDHLHIEGPDAAADVRDKTNTVVQRSRVMKGGAVQADLVIMRSSLHHQELRDSVLDDTIFSIGEGETSNDTFGTHDIVAKDALKKARAHEAPASTSQVETKPAKAKAKPHVEAKPKDEHVETKPKDDHVEVKPKVEPTPDLKQPEPPKPKVEHVEPAPKVPAKPEKAAPSGAPKADHTHKGYDSDKNHLDSYGNSTVRSTSREHNTTDAGKRVFTNSFTTIEEATLYSGPTGKKHLPNKLPVGSKVHVGDVASSRVQLITSEITEKDNVWIEFSTLGGRGADIGMGNERSDAADKERAEAIRAGLPTNRKPGESKFKWKFGAGFHPALAGVALDGSLMAKVHALMEWAIQNDMVLGDISINSGMRSPIDAHFFCVRYEIARNGMTNISMENLKKLKDGRDHDGNKWYEAGWTKEQVIANAEAKYSKGSKGAVAAAGYNFGDARRGPLDINGGPGVSRHCSGHAVDVDIPWRSEKEGVKGADVWAWEQIYHQFGLTRPLHKDHGGRKSTQESWHIEETGKGLKLEEDA